MGGPAKVRDISKVHVCLQECNISHFMIKQRGWSDAGKVAIGLQSVKLGSSYE